MADGLCGLAQTGITTQYVKSQVAGGSAENAGAVFRLAAHPKLLSPALEIVQRVITGYLVKKSALPRSEIHTGAVTLIQRFGSAANLNIHFHSLVLDGVYRIENGQPVFHPVAPPTAA